MVASPIFLLMRRAALPAMCTLVMLYFGIHALFGQSGWFALDGIRAERSALVKERSRLQAERDALERDIALLDPRGADRDYADELVRKHLGVIRPDEVIVPLPFDGPK